MIPWKEFKQMSKEASQSRRASNRANGARILTAENIDFESKNHGAHLIVQGCIDYWPGTGKWSNRKGKKGRGVQSLITYIRNLENETN